MRKKWPFIVGGIVVGLVVIVAVVLIVVYMTLRAVDQGAREAYLQGYEETYDRMEQVAPDGTRYVYYLDTFSGNKYLKDKDGEYVQVPDYYPDTTTTTGIETPPGLPGALVTGTSDGVTQSVTTIGPDSVATSPSSTVEGKQSIEHGTAKPGDLDIDLFYQHYPSTYSPLYRSQDLEAKDPSVYVIAPLGNVSEDSEIDTGHGAIWDGLIVTLSDMGYDMNLVVISQDGLSADMLAIESQLQNADYLRFLANSGPAGEQEYTGDPRFNGVYTKILTLAQFLKQVQIADLTTNEYTKFVGDW